MKEHVGIKEQKDIERLVAKILKDVGQAEPPLNLNIVREVLRLDLKYYSSTDVGPLQEFAHRIKVAGKQLVSNPSLMLDVIKKAKLSGLWMPDGRKIYLDSEVPEPKHRWILAHEITHSFVPWHTEFLLGDDELTLHPECHAVIEAEANFGAGQLLFWGERFVGDANDCIPNFNNIKLLKERYGNTLTTTFWRFVEERNPSLPAFGLISSHPRHPSIGARPNGSPIHYFVTSPGFRKHFPSITAQQIYQLVKNNCAWSKAGPVVDAKENIADHSGTSQMFVLDGFCNTYQVLTYGYSLTPPKS